MKRNVLLGVFLGLLILSILPGGAHAKTDIEFILDASGSMRAAMEGKTKMEIAKQSIKAALDSIPPDTHVALRVYAHRIEQSDKAQSCLDTELMIPFGPLNKAAMAAKVDSIQPKGYTPIAYSLQQTEKDFGVERESEKVIILVSDGEETCGGDPVQAVKDLIAKGFKIKVNAIGFDTDAVAQAQLKAIAQAGGGQYYDAKDSASLANALKEITQKALLIQKDATVYGSEIQGGNSYETAVQIPLGQELRLNHHQRKGEYDYFYADLKAGQSLIVTMNTREKGVVVQGANIHENDNPYAGYQIHDATRNKIGGEELIGTRNLTKTSQADATASGRYYVLIGSVYDHMHKDHPFKAEVKNFFDAGSDSDAASTPEAALAIQRQTYPENYLMARDDGDLFKIATRPGEALSIKIIPENPKATLMASLMDDMRAETGRAQSSNEGAGVRLAGTATGSLTYLKVMRGYSDIPTKYSIQFEGGAETTPATQPTTQPAQPPQTPPQTPVATPVPPVLPPMPPLPVPPSPSTVGGLPPPMMADVPAIQEVKESKIPWTSPKILKILGSIFGAGFLLGVLGGFFLKGLLTKKPKTE